MALKKKGKKKQPVEPGEFKGSGQFKIDDGAKLKRSRPYHEVVEIAKVVGEGLYETEPWYREVSTDKDGFFVIEFPGHAKLTKIQVSGSGMAKVNQFIGKSGFATDAVSGLKQVQANFFNHGGVEMYGWTVEDDESVYLLIENKDNLAFSIYVSAVVTKYGPEIVPGG